MTERFRRRRVAIATGALALGLLALIGTQWRTGAAMYHASRCRRALAQADIARALERYERCIALRGREDEALLEDIAATVVIASLRAQGAIERSALDAAARSQRADVCEALVALATDRSHFHSPWADEVLARRGDEASLRRLRRRLGASTGAAAALNGDEAAEAAEMAEHIARILCDLGDESALLWARSAAERSDGPGFGFEVARTLGELGEAPDRERLTAAAHRAMGAPIVSTEWEDLFDLVPAIARIGRHDWARSAAIEALERIAARGGEGPAAAAIRADALRSLVELGAPGARQKAIEAFERAAASAEDIEELEAALGELAALGHAPAAPRLRQVIEAGPSPADTRPDHRQAMRAVIAACALDRLGDPVGLQWLAASLEGEDGGAFRVAGDYLVRERRPPRPDMVLPSARRVLSDATADARDHHDCLGWLGRAGDRGDLPLLRRYLTDRALDATAAAAVLEILER